MHFILDRRLLTFAFCNNPYFVGSSLKFGCGVVHQVSDFCKRFLHKTASIFHSEASLIASDKFEVLKRATLRKAGLDPENCKSNMDPTILWPPECVRGMKELDVAAFNKTISVPVVRVKVFYIGIVNRILKKYYLKLKRFSAHQEDPNYIDHKLVFLNPITYAEKENEIKSEVTTLCEKLKVDESAVLEYSTENVQLTYENWDANMTLRAIIPLEEEGVSGFSKIGHMIHVNLKDHLLPYKHIIGTVLLDKSIESVTMIVNKVDTIDNSDNKFRSFSMEVLAGSGDTVTTVKQNHCNFSFDFATVYWNPRLSSEHETIIAMLEATDVLYDVMAGVGPFSVPSSVVKKCRVLANDLNPESYRWLQHNCDLNKVSKLISCYNMDGKDFIKDVIKQDLLKLFMNPEFKGAIHVTMNLPSIAVEFLPSFVGLMANVEDIHKLTIVEPLVHVYMFSKDQRASSCVTRVAYYLGLVDTLPNFDSQVSAALDARHRAKEKSGTADPECCDAAAAELLTFLCSSGNKNKLTDDPIDIAGLKVKEVRFVRKVAPMKAMIRVSVYITKEILMSSKLLLGRNSKQITDSSNVTSNVDFDEIKLRCCKKIKLDGNHI